MVTRRRHLRRRRRNRSPRKLIVKRSRPEGILPRLNAPESAPSYRGDGVRRGSAGRIRCGRRMPSGATVDPQAESLCPDTGSPLRGYEPSAIPATPYRLRASRRTDHRRVALTRSGPAGRNAPCPAAALRALLVCLSLCFVLLMGVPTAREPGRPLSSARRPGTTRWRPPAVRSSLDRRPRNCREPVGCLAGGRWPLSDGDACSPPACPLPTFCFPWGPERNPHYDGARFSRAASCSSSRS